MARLLKKRLLKKLGHLNFRISRLGYRCLGGIDYHLNMVMGQDDLTRQREPVTLFEFQIFNAPDQVEKKEEKFCVEFNHADLYSLFGQLERIQQQLDGLGKS